MQVDIRLEKSDNIAIRFFNGLIQYFKENMGILIGLAALCTVLSIISPEFLTSENVLNIFRQASVNVNLAIGMTLALIICGIDLSVGSILGLSGTVTAGLIANSNLPIPVAILIGLLLGTVLGFLNGKIIEKTGMPPFIVTLAMMQIARGIAYVYTDGQPIRVMNESFNFLGNGYIGPIPLPVIYSTVILIVVAFILGKTKLGRHIYAVGGNKDAARYSGIHLGNITVFTHTVIGFLSAFTGIILCARMYSGQPSVGTGYEMDAIAAAVLGGTSFSGGTGKVGGTLIGVLVIAVLNNGLNLLNVNSFWQLIAKGLVILLAVYFDLLKKRKSQKI